MTDVLFLHQSSKVRRIASSFGSIGMRLVRWDGRGISLRQTLNDCGRGQRKKESCRCRETSLKRILFG